jgi:hypothetical protein
VFWILPLACRAARPQGSACYARSLVGCLCSCRPRVRSVPLIADSHAQDAAPVKRRSSLRHTDIVPRQHTHARSLPCPPAVPVPPARRCAGRASASLPRTRCPLRFSVLLDSSHNLARSADSLHLAHSQPVARSLVRLSHKARAPSIRLRCAHRRCTPRRRSHETRDVSIVPLPLGERMLCGERVGCVLSGMLYLCSGFACHTDCTKRATSAPCYACIDPPAAPFYSDATPIPDRSDRGQTSPA